MGTWEEENSLLATVAHEVEASHQQNQVREKHPVSSKRNLALENEGFRDTGPSSLSRSAHRLSLLVHIGLGQHETEDDDQYRGARAEPEKWSPTVRGGSDETSSKGSRQEIAECVALLQYTRHQSSSLLGEIL